MKDVWSETGAFAETGSTGSSPRPQVMKQAETAIESIRECIVKVCYPDGVSVA